MQDAIVRIFDVVDLAQEARKALLAEGFDADDVTLSIANDEAGPVIGNFTVGNSPIESDSHTYERNYADVAPSAHCLVTVAVGDAALATRAASIMERFGARDADPLAALKH